MNTTKLNNAISQYKSAELELKNHRERIAAANESMEHITTAIDELNSVLTEKPHYPMTADEIKNRAVVIQRTKVEVEALELARIDGLKMITALQDEEHRAYTQTKDQAKRLCWHELFDALVDSLPKQTLIAVETAGLMAGRMEGEIVEKVLPEFDEQTLIDLASKYGIPA